MDDAKNMAHAGRDKNGRFAPGYAGKPKGAKDKQPRKRKITPSDRRALSATAHEVLMERITPDLDALIGRIVEQANEGCRQSQALLMRHAVPPAPGSPVRGVSDLQGLPADVRIRALNDRVLAGHLSVETGQTLVKMARDEAALAVLDPLRDLFKNFERDGDLDAFTEAFLALPLGTVFEHENTEMD